LQKAFTPSETEILQKAFTPSETEILQKASASSETEILQKQKKAEGNTAKKVKSYHVYVWPKDIYMSKNVLRYGKHGFLIHFKTPSTESSELEPRPVTKY
jgi:hypothetical protein